jgi:hypothetical protein
VVGVAGQQGGLDVGERADARVAQRRGHAGGVGHAAAVPGEDVAEAVVAHRVAAREVEAAAADAVPAEVVDEAGERGGRILGVGVAHRRAEVAERPARRQRGVARQVLDPADDVGQRRADEDVEIELGRLDLGVAVRPEVVVDLAAEVEGRLGAGVVEEAGRVAAAPEGQGDGEVLVERVGALRVVAEGVAGPEPVAAVVPVDRAADLAEPEHDLLPVAPQRVAQTPAPRGAVAVGELGVVLEEGRAVGERPAQGERREPHLEVEAAGPQPQPRAVDLDVGLRAGEDGEVLAVAALGSDVAGPPDDGPGAADARRARGLQLDADDVLFHHRDDRPSRTFGRAEEEAGARAAEVAQRGERAPGISHGRPPSRRRSR